MRWASRRSGEPRLARRPDHVHVEFGRLLQHADSDSTGCAVHEDRLACARADDVQRLRRRRSGQQQVRRRGVLQSCRLREHVLGRHDHLRRVSAGDAEGDDRVPDGSASGGDLGVRADRGQHPGHLVADRRRQVDTGARGGDVLVVGRVHPGRGDADGHLARSWLREVYLLELPTVQSTPACRNPSSCHASIQFPRPVYRLRTRGPNAEHVAPPWSARGAASALSSCRRVRPACSAT